MFYLPTSIRQAEPCHFYFSTNMPKFWQGHQWYQVYTATAMCWKCSSEFKLPVLQSSVQFGLMGRSELTGAMAVKRPENDKSDKRMEITGNDPITFNDHINNFHPVKRDHCLYVSNEKLRHNNVSFNCGALENVMCVFDLFLKRIVHSEIKK